MPFDNDRLSRWMVGALFGWTIIFLFWGFLLFHLWLKVPISTIATFTIFGCAIQLALTPWLYSARATSQNPKGRIVRGASAVIVLLTLEALLFFYFVQRRWPGDSDSRIFAVILFGTTVVFGLGALIIVSVFARGRIPFVRPKG